MKNLTKCALIILGVGFLALIIAPFVFTRTGLLSFQDTGPIGDTIGGITAPITGLIGSLLVFLALRAQVKANEIIQGQLDSQVSKESYEAKMRNSSKLYDYFIKNVEDVRHYKQEGTSALIQKVSDFANLKPSYAHDENLVHNVNVATIIGLLKLAELFLDVLNNSGLNPDDIKYFKLLMKHHLELMYQPYIDINAQECSICGTTHNGLPFPIKERFEKVYSMISSDF